MNLSKTSWLILSVGIFVVILAGLGLTHSQQLQEKGQLEEELSVAEKRLNKLGIEELRQRQAELQAQLDENEIQLGMITKEMDQTVESDDVIEEFFQIAQSCGVQVNGISCTGIRKDSLGALDSCKTITLNVSLGGEVSDIIDFVARLNGEFTTGVVRSAQVSIEEDIDSDNSAVFLNLTVYSYKMN